MKRILVTVSRELTVEFGQAFTLRAPFRTIQFWQCFRYRRIVPTLSTKLSWSHFIELLCNRSGDTLHIERTLDGLLDFCDHEPVLQLYKKICRHYWDIDASVTAEYVNAHREYWDSNETGGQT